METRFLGIGPHEPTSARARSRRRRRLAWAVGVGALFSAAFLYSRRASHAEPVAQLPSAVVLPGVAENVAPSSLKR